MKFNREKSKEFASIKLNEKHKIEKFGKVVLTSFGVVLILFGSVLNKNKITINSGNEENLQVMISEYDLQRGKYLEKVHEYKEEFTDINLYEFYQNGKLIINYNGNRVESNLKALYLRYGEIDNNKFIFLSNVLNGRNVDLFTKENNEYAEDYSIVEFRNTTIFENLYNNYLNPIFDNTIELNEEETLQLITMINSWDGKINDMVPQTKAVENKQIWEGNSGEKKR